MPQFSVIKATILFLKRVRQSSVSTIIGITNVSDLDQCVGYSKRYLFKIIRITKVYR